GHAASNIYNLALYDRAASENWHATGFKFWSIPMSALGQKRKFAVQNGMSALPPKADMCGAKRDVRLVPIADIN
ncbi:MAG: hypothetical protein WBE93_05155, partial [Pseudolabrys sp.]